ncbi:MAG: hypothetical protein PHU85_19190, partial [Phycisphaerae bacterium]|nr:hypothetical protein [Phycisphaerae bacterium]
MSRNKRLALGLALILLAAPSSQGLINPNFTPANLMKDAELVLAIRLHEVDAKGRAVADVVKCIKGESPGKTLTVDFSRPGKKEDAAYLKRMIAGQKETPAMIFVGKGENGEPLSKLSIESKWVVIDKPDENGLWAIDVIDGRFQDVWAG